MTAPGPTTFDAIRTPGALLPPDLIARVVAGESHLGGLGSADFHLAGESPREAANRVWSHLLGVWSAFQERRTHLDEDDPAVGLTRERWLLVLFRELGYGRLATTPAGGLSVDGDSYQISHEWAASPIHLLGWGVDLDRRTKGVPGAAERAPTALVQEFLNRTDTHLWGFVSNGRVLRLLRDSTTLSGHSYVEFDLEAIFDGELFSDFVALFLLCHQSRVEIRSGEGGPADCWLEDWRTAAADLGSRALGMLRDGVQQALETLGTGFLTANPELNARIATGGLSLDDYHRGLLRLVYRLLFLFVAEDRDALLDPTAEYSARQRFIDYFSTSRLRDTALRRTGDRHHDQWQALSLVIQSLGEEDGCAELGLVGIGGLFEHGPGDLLGPRRALGSDETGSEHDLGPLNLTNRDLLAAVRHLARVHPKGQPPRRVDYRNLGAEELGGIYESLLELMPRHDSATRTFSLQLLAGNERKTSGSYYTPIELIDLVLDEALDPLLDYAMKARDPEAAILGLTVCDPACGSAHFLVAAARRIAERLAQVRSTETDPTPDDLRDALHDVVATCMYGVDLNPMAIELAKVSLWLEAMTPGRPLSFLDAHFKVGNALLGTTPALLAGGIPDAAFSAIEGDDKKVTAALKKRNKQQRDVGQGDLFEAHAIPIVNQNVLPKEATPRTHGPSSLAQVREQTRRYREALISPEYAQARRTADAWCAAFVQRKVQGAPAITQQVLEEIREEVDAPAVAAVIDDLVSQYQFLHWFLEFPEIFRVPPTEAANTATGRHVGFSCMVGNPPWERVKLQEQEFFASRDVEIAEAPNAAKRRKLIVALPDTQPALWQAWQRASRHAQGVSHFLRSSGRYPLCGVGDVNTYSVFAEHFRSSIATDGQMGIITPTGLATDATTAAFFADTLRSKRLAAFYDFENEAFIFKGVHHSFRFAISSMTGGEAAEEARLAFVLRYPADLPARRFTLEPEEVLLLNPNTGTLPVFRSRRDAEITLGIYRRHPVLMRDGEPGGNSWGLSFGTLFHMANDSGLFRTAEELQELSATFDGWAWSDGESRWLPLYEAKMLFIFDHRFSTYRNATQAELNVGTLPRLTKPQHDDPDCEPMARYWVEEQHVDEALRDRWDRSWLLGWRDIARSGNERTLISSVLPRSAVGHAFPIAILSKVVSVVALQAVLSSLVLDYVARQKLSGTHMTFGVVNQLAVPSTWTLLEVASWDPAVPAGDWVEPRVVELTYTSNHLAAYGHDHGYSGPPFRWIPERRALIRAELDAAMFIVYGLDREEIEHVLDSFTVLRNNEEREHGEFRTRRLVLERYDALAAASPEKPYVSPLDPPPGQGPRHPK